MSQAVLIHRAERFHSRDEPRFRSLDRPLVSSLVISTFFHVSVILLLSLIMLGNDRTGNTTMLILTEQSDASITETPQFKLVLPATDARNAATEMEPFSIDVALASPPKIVALPQPNPTADGQPNSGQSTADVIALAATDNQAAWSSIQQRVAEAGGKKGEVQFALAWKNVNDVDLHVIAPSGERISHLHKKSQCLGLLDVDMNVRGESVEPVENVRWLTNAPWGRYTVLVNLFRIHRPLPGSRVYRGSEFQLLAQLGSQSMIKTDIVNRSEQLVVYRFQYLPDELPTAEQDRMREQLRQMQEQEEALASSMLEQASEIKQSRQRDVFLNSIIIQFPHTDAAIEAMQLLGGNITKD